MTERGEKVSKRKIPQKAEIKSYTTMTTGGIGRIAESSFPNKKILNSDAWSYVNIHLGISMNSECRKSFLFCSAQHTHKAIFFSIDKRHILFVVLDRQDETAATPKGETMYLPPAAVMGEFIPCLLMTFFRWPVDRIWLLRSPPLLLPLRSPVTSKSPLESNHHLSFVYPLEALVGL